MARKKTTASFIADATAKHGDTYDYSEAVYVDSATKVKIICRVEGHPAFWMMPSTHTSAGQGCSRCGRLRQIAKARMSQAEWVRRATKKHQGRYDYSVSEYVNAQASIDIICDAHGRITMCSADAHLNGSGCKKCFMEQLGRYGKGREPEDGTKPATFYIVRLYDEDESFFKVGVTTRTMTRRMAEVPYKYEVIEAKKMPISQAIQKEREVKSRLKAARFIPANKFGGHSECFIELDDW